MLLLLCLCASVVHALGQADFDVLGRRHADLLAVQHQLIQMQRGQVGGLRRHELDQRRVSLVVEDLDPLHVSVHAEQREQHVARHAHVGKIGHQHHTARGVRVRGSGRRTALRRVRRLGRMLLRGVGIVASAVRAIVAAVSSAAAAAASAAIVN